MEKDVKTVETLKEVSEKIKALKADNERLESEIKTNREVFKKWINEKFKDSNYDGSYVKLSDEVNEYSYTIEEFDNEKFLRLKKKPFNSMPRSFGGFGHPMDFFFDAMEKKQSEETEFVYEGNYQPKLKNRENIFEELKEDLLNFGEISTNIKKYITEDRKMRVGNQDKIDSNSKEIRKLEDENRKALKESLKSDFTEEKLSELFANKMTLVNGEKYSLKNYDGNSVKSITFKKETADKYYLELVYQNNDDEDTIKLNKKGFDISNYINY